MKKIISGMMLLAMLSAPLYPLYAQDSKVSETPPGKEDVKKDIAVKADAEKDNTPKDPITKWLTQKAAVRYPLKPEEVLALKLTHKEKSKEYTCKYGMMKVGQKDIEKAERRKKVPFRIAFEVMEKDNGKTQRIMRGKGVLFLVNDKGDMVFRSSDTLADMCPS